MLLLLLFLATEFIIDYKTVNAITESEITYLQENFFASLRNDPRLQDEVLTREKKDFIDEQVDHFIRLTKTSQGIKKPGRQKRSFPIDELESLTRDKYGVYILNSVEEKFFLGTEFAKDIVVFEQDNEWYAAALESDEGSACANKLRLYQKFGESFEQINELDINKGLRLNVLTTLKGTFIAVAENRSQSDPKTKLFMFRPDKIVEQVQLLNAYYVSDIIIWQQNDEIFMAACQQMQIESNQTIYESATLIYKWLGQHFDIIQNLTTYNAQKIATIQIGNSHFLAIANNRNDRGESNIFSEIFKFDLDAQEFLPHQRIATKSARDIAFFDFTVENLKETFLVVANYLDGESNEAASSIIYKHVDDYFIPFQSMEVNGATGWLSLTGPNGEYALLASSASDGIQIFQYDGWRFVESKVQYNKNVFTPGVTSMRSLIYDKKVFVVVSNENNAAQQTEILQLNFVHRNILTEYHDKTLSWCKSALKLLQMEEIQKEIVGQPGRSDMSDSVVSPSDFFVDWQQFNNSNEEEIDKRIRIIQSNLDTQDIILENVDLALTESLQPTFAGDVFARNVIINNELYVEHLFTRELNNMSMHDFTGEVLKLSGFQTEKPLYFSDLTVAKPLNPSHINGKPIETLLHTTDALKLDQVNVAGTAIFEAPINLHGQINNITISNRNILLNRGDQYLSGKLKVAQIQAKRLETPQINKMDLRILQSISMKPLTLENIGNLTVQRLTLMGLFNDVDLTALDQSALKTYGDQEITGYYSFDHLEINDLNAKLIPMEQFVRVNSGEYWVRHDIHITNDISAQNLKIKNSLNHIAVNDKGHLDVLLKNSSKIQFINGFKEIETIKLGDVKFRGRILSKLLENINPVKHIQKPLQISGNFVFRKGVVVEKSLQTKDVANSEGTISIERLHHEGLRINEDTVPIPLHLLQQVKVENVNANKVNGRDTRTFVVTGTNDVQVISGAKFIPGDLVVAGSTEAFNINNINLKVLEATAMKREGNQVLSGKFIIQNLTARRINTSLTQMGERFWSNILTTDQDQIISGKTIVNNLTANHFESTSLFCDGTINNYNFTNVVHDTITYSNIININSNKRFINVTVEKLTVEESDGFQELSDFVQLFENAVLHTANIENLTFDGACNGMTNKDFSDAWSLRVNEGLHFENVTILGALQVDSDSINNLKIADLVHKTVKRDESFHFKTGTFDNVLFSMKPIALKGEIADIKLEELNSDKYNGDLEKTNVFNEINVNGSVFFDGLISGFNISELCAFAFGNNENKKLVVEGSTYIKNDLKTQSLNNYNINKIKNTAWFKNKPAHLTGYTTFNEIQFNNDVLCHGYVGGISLEYLANNYFSRTKDQTVSASLEFADLMFENGVEAPTLELMGNVNDLNLQEFLATALLDGMEQFFEQTVYLQESIINGELGGKFLVNGMDLQTEVMRYDKENIVTGLKHLRNVKTDTLRINKMTTVQNVLLDHWIKNSILKSGSFNVTGLTTLNGSLEFKKGIHVHGPFNGVFIDKNHTMLKSVAQSVSGKKTFVQVDQQLVYFKNIHLSGNVNGISVRKIIENQAYKNEDTVINSALNFSRDVSAIDVNFDKLYNGINVTDFVKKVMHFSEFNNIEIAFQKLLNVAYSVQDSLKGQAYYLSTYKTAKEFYYQTYDVVPVLFSDGIHRLAAVYKFNDTSAITFYVWDPNAQVFVKTLQTIQYNVEPTYTTVLKYPEADYFYIEGYNNINKEYVAVITQFANDTSFLHTEFQMEQVKSMSAFTIPYSAEKCIAAVFWSAFPTTVVCNYFSATPEVLVIDTINAIKVVGITVEEVPYIITINSNSKWEESSLNLWKHDSGRRQFYLAQTMYVAQSNDVSAVFYKDGYYIAVSSGHVPNTLYIGSIEIYKYDLTTKQFGHLQSIPLNAPIQVEFAVLPSQELVLFALTESSTEPLVIYEYSGISGFSKKIVASGIGKSVSMRHFATSDHQHFVVLRLVSDVILVLKAVFKGHLYEE